MKNIATCMMPGFISLVLLSGCAPPPNNSVVSNWDIVLITTPWMGGGNTIQTKFDFVGNEHGCSS